MTDEVDRFVRDGLFQQHAHGEVFTNGETKEQREQWLNRVQDTCREAGIAYVVREVEKDGNPAYQFGFADVGHYIAFIHNVYGDMESPGGHVQNHKCGDDPIYRDTFQRAAEMHLRELGIKYRAENSPEGVSFVFDRFSDRMMLLMLIENGTLETSVHGLALARSYQQALTIPKSGSSGPRPGP